MALNPREVPITREQVQGWIDDWVKEPEDDRPPLKDFIYDMVDDLNLPDPNVNTYGHDQLPDSMGIADFLILDLESYRVPNGD